MMRSLMILGRQSAIGLAELESLYGSNKVQPIGSEAALLDVDPCLVAFERLGGTVKFCKVLTELDTINWREIEQFLIEVSPGHAQSLPDGKMRLGLSVYGLDISSKKLLSSGLTLKKAIRQSGRSVRLVPNASPALNSAQVLHNQLTGPLGWELIFVRDHDKTIVAQSVMVQDINSYTLRDRGRPKRDARVGMLPPKLAQIIINLAVGELPEEAKQSVCDIPPNVPIPKIHFDKTLLDPFCGTGVVLQEALLMGYSVKGTDIDQRMVEYSIANVIDWFNFTLHPEIKVNVGIAQGDATNKTWEDDVWNEEKQDFDWKPATIDFVASETYLGRPFTTTPKPEVLQQTISDVNVIIKKFLLNLSKQIAPGVRLCLAIPAWQTNAGFKHLPVLDHLTDMGYNRLSFVHAAESDLIYHREGQFVGRELVVLTRK